MQDNAELHEKIHSYLQEQEDILVPMVTIWHAIAKNDISFVDFALVIDSDQKISIVEGSMTIAEVAELLKNSDGSNEVLTLLLQQLGPKLFLKAKFPQKDQLFLTIAKQLRVINDALLKAYQARDKDDKAGEAAIVQALQKSKQLEDELLDAFKAYKKVS